MTYGILAQYIGGNALLVCIALYADWKAKRIEKCADEMSRQVATKLKIAGGVMAIAVALATVNTYCMLSSYS